MSLPLRAEIVVVGAGLAGLSASAALLLGAALAPTDPVLAGDLQVDGPGEGDTHGVRFTLTAEAGLNDGLAFPFVYLAIAVASFASANTKAYMPSSFGSARSPGSSPASRWSASRSDSCSRSSPLRFVLPAPATRLRTSASSSRSRCSR